MSKKGVITFIDYKVNKVLFELNSQYIDEEVDVTFEVGAKITVSDDKKNMNVNLVVDIFRDDEEKIYPFHMLVEIEGFFESNLQEGEDISPYSKNAVAILFPYIRALVSNYTANANVTPLILPTVNVNKLLEEQEKHNS